MDSLPLSAADFLTGLLPDGSGQHSILRSPPLSFGSYSGELKLQKVWATGGFNHKLAVSTRARRVRREFGGADVRDFGRGVAGVRTLIPEPPTAFGPLTHDRSRQGTIGVSYDVLAPAVGELGVGLQKSLYRRTIDQPGLPLAHTRADPFLYNVNASVFVSRQLAFYGSYTRGLEETGTAPQNALNRGQAMPASITQQVDAGLRYAFVWPLKLLLGVFQVEKPYFNLSSSNVYGPLGAVRHRGIEASISGPLLPNLNIVAGAVLLQPHVSGEAVDSGRVGPIPLGPRPRFLLLSAQYQPPAWGGFSIDGQLTCGSAQIARRENDFRAPGWTQFDFGVRYRFTAGHIPAALRLQVFNVTNAYNWNVDSSGAFFPRSPRNLQANLTADF